MNCIKGSVVSLAVLLIGMAGVVAQAWATVGPTYTVTVNATGDLGALDHFWSRCASNGNTGLQLKAEMRTHMTMAHNEWGLQMTSHHGLFNDYIHIYDEDANGNPVYNWTLFDSAYDYEINTLHMRVHFEFYAMPLKLAASTSKTLSTFEGVTNYVSLPKDYTKWKNLCAAVAQHVETRYGAAAARECYFRVWNENNGGGFSFGTLADYEHVYDYAVMGVKSVDTLLKVGGPSYAGGGSSSDMTSFVNHCRTQNFADGTKSSTPLDLLSFTMYCSGDGDVGLGDGECVASAVQSFSGYISPYPAGTVKIHCSEYGTDWARGPYQPNNYDKHDSPIAAAFIGMTVGSLLYDWSGKGYGVNNTNIIPPVLSYWMMSDMFEEDGDNSSRDFINCHGMITYKHSIKKPSWNTMKLLNMLGDHLLSITHSAPGDTCKGIAAKNSTTGAVQVYLYNLQVQNVTQYQTATVDHPIKVTVNNMTATAGSVRREVYLIDKTHSNAFQVWVNMGRPNPLTQAQADSCIHNQELQRVSVDTAALSGGTVTDSVYLQGQGVALVVFTPLPITTTATSLQVRPTQQSVASHAARLLVSRGSITIPSSMLGAHRLIKVYDLHGRQVAIVRAGKDGKMAQNITVTTNEGWVIARPEL